MVWMILPPQPAQHEEAFEFSLNVGPLSNWPSEESFQAFNRANLSSNVVSERQLPVTRNPNTSAGALELPSSLSLLVKRSDGGAINGFQNVIPDAIFGAGYNWVISARLKAILEEIAPGEVGFEPIALTGPRKIPIEGDWFLLVFKLLADILEEDRSNLLQLYRTYGNWHPKPDSFEPMLIAKRSSVDGLKFWSGAMHKRQPPINAASVGFTYCSDSIMERLRANEITGFGPAYKIDLIEDDDKVTIAPGSPAWAQERQKTTDRAYVSLRISTARFGGVAREEPSVAEALDGKVHLVVPADPELPDIWSMERLLIVSDAAKTIIESIAGKCCDFEPVFNAPNKDGEIYTGTNDYYVLIPKSIFQPFIPELSKKIRAGILPNGKLSLVKSGADVAIDDALVGEIALWDATAPGTGAPDYFLSKPLFDALVSGGISGLEEGMTFSGFSISLI